MKLPKRCGHDSAVRVLVDPAEQVARRIVYDMTAQGTIRPTFCLGHVVGVNYDLAVFRALDACDGSAHSLGK